MLLISFVYAFVGHDVSLKYITLWKNLAISQKLNLSQFDVNKKGMFHFNHLVHSNKEAELFAVLSEKY